MKKVFKILWKIIFGYFIANTLAWAFIGSGRYLEDCDQIGWRCNAYDVARTGAKLGEKGWTAYIKNVKSLFKH